MAKPLDGITVLDLSRVLAGPYCGMLLGDFGADVIKVEMPGRGDDSRAWAPPSLGGESAYYLSANRNKRSMTLNLKNPAGREIFKLLVQQADIILENFKFGDMVSMGLGYDKLAIINPGLIYCSFTGFGAGSPYQDRPGYDFVIQAMSGHMSITGDPQGEPMKHGVAIVDVLTGLYGCNAVQAALRHRDTTGQGQFVEISLMDSALAALINVASSFLVDGGQPRRYGNAHATVVPYESFAARNGYFVLAIGNDSQFRALCQAIGLPGLGTDERFATNPARVSNRAALLETLYPTFLQKDVADWLEIFGRSGVPAGPINSVPQILNDPHVASREMVVEVPHPTGGSALLMAPPFKLSVTPATVDRHPPLLGEHTAEILSQKLGLGEGEVEELRKAGAI